MDKDPGLTAKEKLQIIGLQFVKQVSQWENRPNKPTLQEETIVVAKLWAEMSMLVADLFPEGPDSAMAEILSEGLE